MQVRHFVNLTNGIQAIEDYDLRDFRFIRIQSTACEQKRWEEILLSLSDDFLMSAANGAECIVYDYGANKTIPRAVWQGLEWVKYSLRRRWHGLEHGPQGRAATSGMYFAENYGRLSKRAKARLDYFSRYIFGPLRVSALTSATSRDGDTEWYVNAVSSFLHNISVERP
jgi:hypothetical protein